MDAPDSRSLPENAYRPLEPGEAFHPIVPPAENPPQASGRAVAWGLFLCFIFTVAAAYSGLKVGQVMEAAIPISILAIGIARMGKPRMHLLENAIITGIGGASGAVVAGAIFTLPALYILKLDPHPLQTTFICLAGGCLGVLFLIPLRRYFVRDTHGEFPYPEATAITEVLVTGEKGGSQAGLLLRATGIAAVFDLLVTTFQVWRETLTFKFFGFMQAAEERARVSVHFTAEAFILGLGYVMGLRSSLILCAGGVLSNFVLVPLIFMIGKDHAAAVYPALKPIADLSTAEIFKSYVRLIGVGAIATAGIFGILKSLRIVLGSFSIAAKTFRADGGALTERTDRDLPLKQTLFGVLLAALGVGVFFADLGPNLPVALLGFALALLFSFFFTSVAANAIATTARNPVSGMTMLTIIISSVVLLRFGLSGTTGMFFVMAIAGMVCTALSVSGQTVTDLKVGYWLGATPAVQQRVKFYGVAVASIAAALTIVMLSQNFAFGEAAPGDTRKVLDAPQAAIMKSLVEGFMNRQPVAYVLFFVGALIAVMLEMLKVSALTFALGMYLPLELNLPALVGGYLHHYITRRSEQVGGVAGRTARERGVIIASGLMAGGAIGGVIGASLRLIPGFSESWIRTPFFDHDTTTELVSAAGFLLLCLYLFYGAVRGGRRGAR